MTSETAAAAGGVALLERAVNYTLGCIHLVTPSALTRQTPCRGWDLRMLLRHMDESVVSLIEAVGPAVQAGTNITDEVSALRGHVCELVGAWAAAPARGLFGIDGRTLSGGVVGGTGALEVAVHGWDIARACASPRPIPSSLADEMLDLAVLLVTDAERPGLFAPAVPVPVTATYSDRLVAYLGRDPA